MITGFDIDGGTRLLVDSTAAAEVAAVGFWYGTGSRDEPPSMAGSKHFVEHMLFKGTTRRDAFSIAREIDRLGGSINAFTERECVALYAVVPAEGFEAAFAILADLAADSLFDAAEFERERIVIENEIAAADDDPEEAAADAFAERLWPGHPLARKIGGEVRDVRRLTREAVFAHYRDSFRGAPPLVSVAGGVDAERAARSCADAFPNFGSKAVRDAPERVAPPRPKSSGESFRIAPYQHVQTFCSFQMDRTVPDADYYALDVANAAIGESMGSRLFQELRERRGLCYSVFSAPTLMTDSSLWTTYATASDTTSGELVEAYADEILRLARDGLTEEEVADAKAHVRGSMKIAAADAEYRMRRIARQALYGAPRSSCEESEAKVAEVSADAANEAIRPFLAHAPTIYGVGMKSARKTFSRAAAKALERFAGAGMKVDQ